MADDSAGEKSQDATQHRRQQAREQGQVAHSNDLGSAAILMGALIVLALAGKPLLDYLAQLFTRQLGGDAWLVGSTDFVVARWNETLWGLGPVLLPILGLALGLAVLSHWAQVGLLFLPEKLIPDFTRIDPLKGLARLISLPSLVRLVFGLLKVGIVSAVAITAVYSHREQVLALAAMDVAQIAQFAWSLCFWTVFKIALALLILALIDYGFQWWQNEQEMKMSPQEIREEMRNLQGDPAIIARRRGVQRQIAMNRISKAVPAADVVVTNPTELAVALQYDPSTMAAPVVVAKGAGLMAQRIRRLALESGVPIVEKKPLAQALFKEVDLNHPIPNELYAGVAEVLAYVYQLKGKTVTPPGAAGK